MVAFVVLAIIGLLRGTYAFIPFAVILVVVYIWSLRTAPSSVFVSDRYIVLRTWGSRKALEGYKVLGSFRHSEFRKYVYACLVGWRVAPGWFYHGTGCSTAYGPATVFSTPDCSGLWLTVEAGGRRYVVCCEERDRLTCEELAGRARG